MSFSKWRYLAVVCLAASAAMAVDARDGVPPPLTDPALLLSLVPRLQEIGRLLEQVRAAPMEHAPTEGIHSTRDAAAADAAPALEMQGPSLALGTVNEDDDDWDPWTASDGAGAESHIPADLQARLAQEATALQSTLAQAHAALDAAPGADMSIDDQVDLLARLEAYRARQAYVLTTYAGESMTFGPSVWQHCAVRPPWSSLPTRQEACALQRLLRLQEHRAGVSSAHVRIDHELASVVHQAHSALVVRDAALVGVPDGLCKSNVFVSACNVPSSDGENARFTASSWAGWMTCFPSKPRSAPSRHSSSK